MKAVKICKAFGENKVLTDFSYEFKQGKVTAVLGASGCGKTTLLNILMGIISPDSGEVIRESDKISAVFQENRLCENLTASANIRLVTGKRFTKKQVEENLENVGLFDCANKKAGNLSGGMKRRTALVRALLAEYDILFLDEPFKGLDSDTKNLVMDYTAKKIIGKTVVLVTHDLSECERLADDIINL